MDTDLLAQIERASREFSSLLQQLPERAATEPNILGIWSAADILAHLIGWQEEAIAVLLTIRDGNPPPQEVHLNEKDLHEEDELYDPLNHMSWTELKSEFAETYRTLLEVARSLNEVDWLDPVVARWLQQATLKHYRVHRPDFEQLLAWRQELQPG